MSIEKYPQQQFSRESIDCEDAEESLVDLFTWKTNFRDVRSDLSHIRYAVGRKECPDVDIDSVAPLIGGGIVIALVALVV